MTYRFARPIAPVLTAALLLASALTAVAQEAFTPHHVAKIRTVAAAAVSPDGTEIAYTLVVPRIPFEDDDGPAWTELHVTTADGESRPYVTGAGNVAAVRWTPDGRGLVFLARRSGDDSRALYIVPRDGGEAQRVLTHASDILSYEFSRDGRQIAFVAREAPSKERQDLARRGFNQEVFEEMLQEPRVWIVPNRGHDGGRRSARGPSGGRIHGHVERRGHAARRAVRPHRAR